MVCGVDVCGVALCEIIFNRVCNMIQRHLIQIVRYFKYDVKKKKCN